VKHGENRTLYDVKKGFRMIALVTRLLFVTIAFSVAATSAYAQYVWLDEKGSKQFSDMPPPASIPQKNIIKSPAVTTSSLQSPSSVTDVTPTAPVTTAEKNIDFNKRKLAQADKDKKAANQARMDAEKMKHCERARDYKQLLDSGERIGQTDRQGERGIMSDEQRRQELRDVKTALDNCTS
jgi:hypothetical protein